MGLSAVVELGQVKPGWLGSQGMHMGCDGLAEGQMTSVTWCLHCKG